MEIQTDVTIPPIFQTFAALIALRQIHFLRLHLFSPGPRRGGGRRSAKEKDKQINTRFESNIPKKSSRILTV